MVIFSADEKQENRGKYTNCDKGIQFIIYTFDYVGSP